MSQQHRRRRASKKNKVLPWVLGGVVFISVVFAGIYTVFLRESQSQLEQDLNPRAVEFVITNQSDVESAIEATKAVDPQSIIVPELDTLEQTML